MTECRYVDKRGYYLPTHRPRCEDHACGGCQPCEADHCTARRRCTSHLDPVHPLTCPRCVGRTRADIDAIVDLHAAMPTEALARGVDSEAAVLAGPAADPEAWSWHRIAAKRRGVHPALVEDDDPHHALAVLGRWDFMLREDYGQPTDTPVTVAGSAAYLDGLLTRLAQDPEQDWPLFAAEVAACRTHHEAVIHDSRTPEQGRPCPVCSTPEEPGPKLAKQYADHDRSGASDTWHCPREEAHWWREAEYRHRVAGDYLAHADRLTASQLAGQYGVREGTVRQWAARGTVRRRGVDHHGLTTYDVSDTLAMLAGVQREPA